MNLTELFESTTIDNRFMYRQMAESPLKPINSDALKQRYMDPTTGKPYDGILLFGEFASIDTLNNNNRRYSAPNYLKYVELLRQECASPKGVYGQYEHPKGYAVDGKKLSHKVLDLWYDERLKKVFGYVMILNSHDGKQAQEVIKSGGLLGISARGGGAEIQNNDGTINAELALLVTFDLVYHPGFKTSLVGTNDFAPSLLFEDSNGQFQEDEQHMQENEPEDKKSIENQLKNAVDKKDKKTTKLNESFSFQETYIANLKKQF